MENANCFTPLIVLVLSMLNYSNCKSLKETFLENTMELKLSDLDPIYIGVIGGGAGLVVVIIIIVIVVCCCCSKKEEGGEKQEDLNSKMISINKKIEKDQEEQRLAIANASQTALDITTTPIIKTQIISITPDIEEKIIALHQNEVNELKDILNKQFGIANTSPSGLQEAIIKNSSQTPYIMTEESMHSKTFAKITIRKEIQMELCEYDSGKRSNQSLSLSMAVKPSKDDEIYDKDPRLREPNIYIPEERDYFEIEKAARKPPPEEVFPDEEIIQVVDPNLEIKVPVIATPTPVADDFLNLDEAPQPSIFVDPAESAAKKKEVEEKNVTEFKSVIMKSIPNSEDIVEKIKINAININKEEPEDLESSITSAHVIIKRSQISSNRY